MRTILWPLTMVTLCHVVSGADPVYTPANLSDTVGNTADSAASITWSDLPDPKPYVTSNPARISEGLKAYYDLVHSFINSVFMQGIPKELIEKGIDGEMNDIISNYSEYVTPFIGYAICAVIGLLFVFIFPIVACCFCCCRCCGKCGGKRQQSPKDSANKCKKVTFILILLTAGIFVMVGSICIYINNDNISTMLDNIPDTAADNVDDMKTYVNNTINVAEHLLIDNFDFLKLALFRDLDNIGYLVGVPFKEDIENNTGITSTLSNAYNLANNITSIDSALTDVENKLTAFNTSVNEFSDAIEAVKTNLDNIFTTCGALCPAANRPDYSSATVYINTTQFPDLSGPRTSMDEALASNLTSKIADAEAEFLDIPYRVERDANATIIDMKNTINDLNDTIDDILQQMNDVDDDINGPSDKYGINSTLDLIQDFVDLAKTYDTYRWYGGVGLSSLCLLVVFFAVLGVVFGFFGTRLTTPPADRGCVSNCGGIFLMVAAAIILIFSALLMFLTVLTFIPGAPIYKAVCEPITDLEKLEELFTIYNDKQVGAGKYYLGDLIHNNDTIPLTLSGILTDCKNGETAFTAFKFDVKYDIDDLFNYTDTLDVQAEIDAVNIDLTNVTIYSTETNDQLQDIKDAVNISYSDFYDELNQNISNANLSSLADDIDTYAASVVDPTSKDALKAEADELRRIESEEYVYVQGNLTELNSSVAAMEAISSPLPGLITDLDAGLQEADDYVKNNGSDSVKAILNTYADRLLGIVDSFVSYTKNGLLTNIGTCEPVWNIYNSALVYTVCYNAMDCFNGFWFSLGWVIFFFMPTLIFSVKLVKYFRTMDESEDDPPPYDDNKHPGAFDRNGVVTQTPSRAKFWMKTNKVAHRDADDW